MGKLKYIVAIFCVVIFLYTTAPFMLWQDAPQLTGAIESFGISRPAEPIYVFLGHIFTLLPFGSILFRIHLFNSLLAGLTLLVLYELIVSVLLPALQTTSKNKDTQSQEISMLSKQQNAAAGIFTMLTLAFSYEFWSQAQNIETFILCCLLELIILYLLFKEDIFKSSVKRFLIIFFICGIATGTDPPVVACVYPLVLLVVWRLKKSLELKLLMLFILSGLLGVILAWSILPFMQLGNPRLDSVNGLTISGIWNVATGAHQNSYNPSLNEVNGLTWAPAIILQDASYYISTLYNDFTFLVWPFVIVGCFYLWKSKRRRRILLALGLVLLINFILCILYDSGNEENWELQSEVILTLIAGIGFYWMSLILSRKWKSVSGIYFLGGGLLIGILLSGYWWSTLNRSNWNITEDYLSNVYAPLQAPAIMIGSEDLWDSVSDYAYAANFKPGVIPILDIYFYADMWNRTSLQTQTHIQVPSTAPLNDQKNYSQFYNDFIAQNLPKYRIYITLPALHAIYFGGADLPSLQLDTNKFKLIPDGLVEEVVPKNVKMTVDDNNINYHFGNDFPNQKPKYFERTSVAQMQFITDEMALSYDSVGVYNATAGHAQNALVFLDKAHELSPDNTQILSDIGTFYGNQGKYALALMYFSKGHELDPEDEGYLYDMAVANEKLGNSAEEQTDLETIVHSTVPDPNIAPLALEKLNSLSTQAKVLMVPQGWKPFKNLQMNITFGYPPTMDLIQVDPQMVSISNTSDKNAMDSMLIYSTTGVNDATIHLPFSVPTAVLQTQNIPMSGFTAKMKIYGTSNKSLQLLYLQHKNQMFVVRFPQNQAIDPAIVKGIVQSIIYLR